MTAPTANDARAAGKDREASSTRAQYSTRCTPSIKATDSGKGIGRAMMPVDQSCVSTEGSTSYWGPPSGSSSSNSAAEPYSADQGSSEMTGRAVVEAGDSNMISDFTLYRVYPASRNYDNSRGCISLIAPRHLYFELSDAEAGALPEPRMLTAFFKRSNQNCEPWDTAPTVRAMPPILSSQPRNPSGTSRGSLL